MAKSRRRESEGGRCYTLLNNRSCDNYLENSTKERVPNCSWRTTSHDPITSQQASPPTLGIPVQREMWAGTQIQTISACLSQLFSNRWWKSGSRSRSLAPRLRTTKWLTQNLNTDCPDSKSSALHLNHLYSWKEPHLVILFFGWRVWNVFYCSASGFGSLDVSVLGWRWVCPMDLFGLFSRCKVHSVNAS